MIISASDIQDMIQHWLETPIGSILGTDYGNNANELISMPDGIGVADGFIKKLMLDVPILTTLPRGSINVYKVNSNTDKLKLILAVAGDEFNIN